jgi:hypothetical protein
MVNTPMPATPMQGIETAAASEAKRPIEPPASSS